IDKDHFYFYEYLNRKYTWGHLRCQIKGLWGQNSDQSPSIEDRMYKLLVVTARLSLVGARQNTVLGRPDGDKYASEDFKVKVRNDLRDITHKVLNEDLLLEFSRNLP
ncbi:MAG: hypothetical protein WCG27_07930, partial [Pseudomonadota bacterium]